MKIIKKYKLKFILIVVLFCNNIYGQQITIKRIESRLITNEGIEFVGKLRDKSKDHYLFQNWSNKGTFILKDSTRFNLSNINFNVSTNAFSSRIDAKKYFLFRNSIFNSVVINDHLFKKVNDYFYEVLFEKNDNSLLKRHELKLSKGSINGLGHSSSRDFTSLSHSYLIKIGDIVKKIELNKRSIIGLLREDYDKVALQQFVNNEKLSYKKVADIISIFEFMLDNSNILN